MPRVAQKGLSHHAEKGFRISIGKKPDGNYRTFWLGKDRVLAEYHADTLKGQFSHMQADGRSIWNGTDEQAVRWYVDQFRNMMSKAYRIRASGSMHSLACLFPPRLRCGRPKLL